MVNVSVLAVVASTSGVRLSPSDGLDFPGENHTPLGSRVSWKPGGYSGIRCFVALPQISKNVDRSPFSMALSHSF